MKYTFETNNEREAKLIVSINELISMIFDYEQILRQKDKYGTPDSLSKEDAISELRETYHEMLIDRGINLDELI